MDRFSEKSLTSLNAYYVYGLIDPRNKKYFYIGKGTGNRVFEHETESIDSSNSNSLKLATIKDIKDSGLEVEKVIINANLTEQEAYAAEASLINAFNYIADNKLTNIVAGHHSKEALSVEEYERIYGAIDLKEEDIKHNIMIIKINQLYHRGMDKDVLYDTVRGVWKASLKRAQTMDYVFGVYDSLIVAVYKPSEWFICNDNQERLPRQDIVLNDQNSHRIFFIDKDYENGVPMDANQMFYYGKSIGELKLHQSAQNPVTYLSPKE